MQPQSETAQNMGSELASDAKNVGTSAVNRLHREVDARKGDAVSQAKSVSTAIDQAAGGLDDNAPAWLKSSLRQGAEQVQRFADTIEQKDSRQLVTDVSDFARRSPGTFLAACAAAGFAASRIFKAGGPVNNTPGQLGAIGVQPGYGAASTSPASTSPLPIGNGVSASTTGNFATSSPGASGSDAGGFDSDLSIHKPTGQYS